MSGRSDVRVRFVKYTPDNGMATGFGGYMNSIYTARLASRVAREVLVSIKATAPQKEIMAQAAKVAPGWVTQVFRSAKATEATALVADGPFLNPRSAVRISVDTPAGRRVDLGDKSKNLRRPSAVSLEFGTKYNEGTDMDMPPLHVMRDAAFRFAAAMPGMNFRQTRSVTR